MRKSSTGERLDLNFIRAGVRKLLSRGDSAQSPDKAADDQSFVEQLMDTTPSSSFDEDEWRDGFVYERPAAPKSPEVAPGAGQASALGAAAAGGDGVEDMFVKESVPQLDLAKKGRPSLLSSRIDQLSRDKASDDADAAEAGASGRPNLPAGWGSDAAAARAVAAAAPPPPAAAPRTGQCTVSQLISALLRHEEQPDEPHLFDLRIMEDDGSADMDFPELDKTVSVTAFGVQQFVMCKVGEWGTVVLEVQLLSSAGPQLQVGFKEPGGAVQQMTVGGPAVGASPNIAIRNLDSGQVVKAHDVPKGHVFHDGS
jgi:hypothetical protein